MALDQHAISFLLNAWLVCEKIMIYANWILGWGNVPIGASIEEAAAGRRNTGAFCRLNAWIYLRSSRARRKKAVRSK